MRNLTENELKSVYGGTRQKDNKHGKKNNTDTGGKKGKKNGTDTNGKVKVICKPPVNGLPT